MGKGHWRCCLLYASLSLGGLVHFGAEYSFWRLSWVVAGSTHLPWWTIMESNSLKHRAVQELWLDWHCRRKALLDQTGRGKRGQIIGINCVSLWHLNLPLAWIQPESWSGSWRVVEAVLLFLWCIRVGQASGAWRLNSFLCSNVALFLPKATYHFCGWL